MNARLFTIPASHPGWTAQLMLEHKGIEYKRVDLIAIISKGVLRAARFPGVTVPALILDGRRTQGSRAIARELDRVVSEPALLPEDPAARDEVLEAERWGDDVLQSVARRVVWNRLVKDRKAITSYLEGARLGLPISLAGAVAPPIAYLSARSNQATDERTRDDLAALPGYLDRIDELIERGVIGGDEPNAADFQIAPSLALMMTLDDLAPHIVNRPAGRLAARLVPNFPGHLAAGFPPEWLEPLRERVTSPQRSA